MDAMQAEAMMVRHTAAITLRKTRSIDPLEALEMVLAPPPSLLAASLKVASERGASTQAHEIARRSRSLRARRAKHARGVVRLDELLPA